MILKLNNICKSFGEKEIFHNLNLELHERDIVGILGDNGTGKTTLLKIICNEESFNSGEININPNNIKINYLRQFIDNSNSNLTIDEYVLYFFDNLGQIYSEILSLTNRTDEKSINRLMYLQDKFSMLGGYDVLGNIDEYLIKLGLKKINSESIVTTLSGGQKTRLQFIRLLAKEGDILLLDEPTNHLDSKGIEWFEGYLKKKNGIIIIVSHDRSFLNNIVNKIFDMEDFKIYSGNYDDYKRQKELFLNKEYLIYKSKMKEINRLQNEANKKLSESHTTDQKFNRGWEGPVIRKKSGKKAKTAQIIQKRIEKQIENDLPNKPIKKDHIKFNLKTNTTSSKLVCKLENINFSYKKNKNLFFNINLEIWQKDRIAVIGENGSGKTTLLKIIAKELNLNSGKIKFGENVKIGYFSQEHELLNEENSIIEEFRKNVEMSEEEARTFLYFMLFHGDKVFQKIKTLSQGEKSKLVLAILLSQDINFLILDEPTNHLDISSREVLEESLKKYKGTLLVVSHDNYFLNQIQINKFINL